MGGRAGITGRRRRALRSLLARAGYAALPRLGYRADRVGPGAVLITRPGVAGRQWMAQERELFAHLAVTQLAGLLRQYRVNCLVDVGQGHSPSADALRGAGFSGEVVTVHPAAEPLAELVLPVAEPRVFLRVGAAGPEVLTALGDRAQDVVGLQAQLALLRLGEDSPGMCETLEAYGEAGFEIGGLYPLSRQRRTARVLEYDCVMVRALALSRPRFPTRSTPARTPRTSAG